MSQGKGPNAMRRSLRPQGHDSVTTLDPIPMSPDKDGGVDLDSVPHRQVGTEPQPKSRETNR